MADTAFICVTCGTQFSPSTSAPEDCPVCQDERQYVSSDGQRWTTLDALRRHHRNSWQRLEPGLYGIGVEPTFAIGQRALLVQTAEGNVLWDCVALLDDATVDLVRALGGLVAIAISHPHYYTTMVEWARALDVPVYLHAADQAWVMRPDGRLHFWDGPTCTLPGGLTLVHCGGHFEGGTVLHWPGGSNRQGALLAGDILQVLPDQKFVSFMRSYPNLIPLSRRVVERIQTSLQPFTFDRIYGAWWDRRIDAGAQLVLQQSVERYINAMADRP